MADWIFFDHHTYPLPLKKNLDSFAIHAHKDWHKDFSEKTQKKIHQSFPIPLPALTLTGGSAESFFHIFFSHYVNFIRETGRTHVLTLETEPSVLVKQLKKFEKCDVQNKKLPVNAQGQLTPQALREALKARSGLLSLSLAHPLTGVLQPIHDLLAVCKEHQVQVHLDISYAIGKFPLNWEELEVDFLTFDTTHLRSAIQTGVLFSKYTPLNSPHFAPCYYSHLLELLNTTWETQEAYAMEINNLRNSLEKQLLDLNATIFFQDAQRLPNCVVAAFEGIHAEQLLFHLKKQGIFAATGGGELAHILRSCQIPSSFAHCAIAFTLSEETTKAQVTTLLGILSKELEKLRTKPKAFSQEDARAKNMRICYAKIASPYEDCTLTLSLLIDEEDGIIADGKWEIFGPPILSEMADAVLSLLLRKNYMQARRISSEAIETKMKEKESLVYLNLFLEVIDTATEACMDIPIEDIYIAPPDMNKGERTVYPNWEQLSNLEKKAVIAQVMAQDIAPYVELDAGGVEVLHVEDNFVTIAYSGNCTSCYSSTGATLDAIGNILRNKIYPSLIVTPDSSFLKT